mmetsp:Transcript_15179/g.45770  ORF Transcript_15179/g.45770 Transcript_15179/m.45770 type:complete len:255 (+) Transcript_15179:230-994(+)|eukprot:CAMPEP_0206144288 /NCGR_PEP_ID=MMETSP1473-20131121/23614_1 /ASSEMBLY_ACC=CAM_ASM_001109 /TAXON_ID=1461547 /ORGANISM="Stichococcus sp, Strain RCC1054" /LENGTH=254 /DNA_ID=CAMNT_0053540063 /DNA_START=134 /DNA_END=898 /DNA_ORIENTATION=-
MAEHLAGSIKAVFFDLDDTLLQTTEADNMALQEVAAKLKETHPHVSWADLHKAWAAAFKQSPWDTNHEVPVEVWRGRLWAKALEQQGVVDGGLGNTLQKNFTTYRTARFQFSQDVAKLVAEVRRRGYRVVIITNGHPEIQRGKIEATAAAATVSDHIIIGGDEVAAGRQEKPHPGIFHRACQLVDCQPHEALHVGDSLASDVQGGINAGLGATVWVSPTGAGAPGTGPQPTFTIAHVTDLLPVLEQLKDQRSGQ